MGHHDNQYGLPRRQWVVLNTQPHRERLAIDNLERQSFTAYCPMIVKRIRHARRTFEAPRPLFPGYVFVEASSDVHLWRPLLSTVGVRTVVRCGDQLSFLDADFIDGIKAREVNGAVVRPIKPYAVGQQVRMTGGALEGLIATIIEVDEKDRLVLLLDLLNRPVKVKLGVSGVREI